ncbi:MAG: tetratricopeptide repeat protein, partial [Candidatus Latescibacterota bacterium]
MIRGTASWFGRASLSRWLGVLLLAALLGGASGCAGAWGRGPARSTPGEAEQRQARRYFVQAKVYQAERNWLGAIVALRCAADLDPTSPTIFSELSSSFRALGDLPMALRFARRAVELDPERSDLRRAMVQLLERSEEPGQAVAEVELLVEQEPDNWRLYRHLAYLYLQTGRTERISPLFHRVLRRPDAPVEVKTDIAAVLFRVGEQRQAEEIYRRILREHPETEDAWLGLAEVLQARGQREEALTVYRQAGHALTESPVVYYYLARALTTGEDLDRVLREEDTGFLYRLGVAFSEAGKQEQAIRIFNEIVGKEPSTAEGWLDLARYYVGQEEFDQADQVMERAVAAVP